MGRRDRSQDRRVPGAATCPVLGTWPRRLVPYFNKAGWYWGGGYRGNFNDPMHSECGHALLQGFTS
ncbi:MAG: hypothetical protein EOP66_01270 [Sphingomonas sp.]|nr:MAG: hypothetical protein EOP66_01270 [Sphingomonas sp.]